MMIPHLGELEYTLQQKSPIYPYVTVPITTVLEDISIEEPNVFPITYTLNDSTYTIYNETGIYYHVTGEGEIYIQDINNRNVDVALFYASTHKFSDSRMQDIQFNGVDPTSGEFPTLSVTYQHYLLDLKTYANNYLDISDYDFRYEPWEYFTINSISSAGVSNVMRDLWFVVYFGNKSEPTFVWDSTMFYPLDGDNDMLVPEKSKTNVFMLSEFRPNKFMVAKKTF